jgi:hypothetical protein
MAAFSGVQLGHKTRAGCIILVYCGNTTYILKNPNEKCSVQKFCPYKVGHSGDSTVYHQAKHCACFNFWNYVYLLSIRRN